MRRRELLKRAGVGLLVLRGIGTAPRAVVPVVEAAPALLPAAPLALASGQSLVATGGLCAPLTPYYRIAVDTSGFARPLRNSMPSFSARRGGTQLSVAERAELTLPL